MVSKPTIPGLGLKWPDSWRAVMAHYKTAAAASRAIGITHSCVLKYNHGSSPKVQRIRDCFLKWGWTETELPALTSGLGRVYAKEKYWPPEDRARVELFRHIWKKTPEKHWADRFWDAIVESSEAKVVNPKALAQWTERCKDKIAEARKQREVA